MVYNQKKKERQWETPGQTKSTQKGVSLQTEANN